MASSPTRKRNACARRYRSNAIVREYPARSSTASTFKSRCRRSAIRTSPVATLANRTEIIRQRVNNARDVQLQRFQKRSIHANAQMGARDIKRYCAVNDDAEKLLETAINKLGLIARAYSRLLKVGQPSPISQAQKKFTQPTSLRRSSIEVWTEDSRISQQETF